MSVLFKCSKENNQSNNVLVHDNGRGLGRHGRVQMGVYASLPVPAVKDRTLDGLG